MRTGLSLTLYWDQRDVTPFVDSLTWTQAPRTYYQELSVVFRGWFPTSLTGRWDLYGSYDPSVPRSELLLRGGVIPPDAPGVVDVAGKVVPFSARIVDWAWLAQRTTVSSTLVLAPDRAGAERAVLRGRTSLAAVGKWAFVPAATMHDAVRALATLAGFAVELRLPDYEMAPTVLDPERSLWDSLYGLVEPYKPDVFFRRERNSVIIADTVGEEIGVGRTMHLPAVAIAGLSLAPMPFRHLQRVIVRVPRPC